MSVMTVTGPIRAADIGLTLPHEHLLANRKRVSGSQDHVVEDERLAIAELTDFAAIGGRTIIDLTVPDIGRNPSALRRISQATGVWIVMGSGWYHEKYYPEEVDRSSTDALAAVIVAEFVDGVGDTGVRPGIIGEIGSGEKGPWISAQRGPWISAQEERVLRASARAQREIGCPISTHAFGSRIGVEQLRLLLEEGVSPLQIVIGHSDSIHDPDYHELLARSGAWVQFDVMRAQATWDIRIQAELVAEFIRRGYESQLLLSQDVCAKSHLKAYGGSGYTGLFERYRDAILEAGVTGDAFDRITRHNPARLFGAG